MPRPRRGRPARRARLGAGEPRARTRAEARAAYERAVALDRGQLWARLGLATLLGQDGREDEAAAICRDLEQEAAARLAREPEYHELIGWCRYRLGRLADAAAAFERALAVDADWVSARFDLALVRLLLGDGAAAQRHCEEGLRSLRRRDAALRAGPLRWPSTTSTRRCSGSRGRWRPGRRRACAGGSPRRTRRPEAAVADWLPRAKILEPLGLRGFRILWTGMTVSLVGDGITLVAIAWQVFELSNLPTALGLTMMAMAVPQILLLLFGGFVSDRFERRRVMLLADLVRGGALLALGVLSLAGAIELWHMAAIAAVYGAGNAFFGPAFDAMVPDLVPDELLAQANALDHLVRPVALRLLGPALGGWIIAAVGVGWAFVVDAATFAISVACLLRLGSVHAAPSRAPGDAGAASVWTEIREGFDFVRSAVWLWGTFAAAALAYLVFLGPAEVLLPFLVKNELGGSASDLGNVYAMGGLGAIAASVTMAHRGMPARNMTFVYAAWTLSTLAVVGYGLAGGLWQVMLASFAFHALETAGLIVWLTTKQTHVPTRLLGRVSSLDWLISIGLMPVSYALAGPVAEWLGTRATLVGAGVLGAAITLSFLFLPGMRAVEKSRAGEAGEVPTT